MDNFLKKVSSVLVLSLIFVLTSCTVNQHIDEKDIRENAARMMECVVNEDMEGLFDFYNEDMKENYAETSLREIEQLFDYIDGEIISYDYEGKGGGEENKHDGIIYYYTCHPKFAFTTDSGKIYTIKFSYDYIWNEHPEYEGISMISICENGNWGDKLVIGRCYYNE